MPASRFQINDTVLFQPNINKINLQKGITIDKPSAVLAKVMKTSFTSYGKVLYDLALEISKDEFYIEHPICNVDSCYVCPSN